MTDDKRIKINRLQTKLVRCLDGQVACDDIELDIMLLEDGEPEFAFESASRSRPGDHSI